MKPEIKQRWLEALRSGDYQQGRCFLRYDFEDGKSEYCCLGVLCDIYSKENEGSWEESSSRRQVERDGKSAAIQDFKVSDGQVDQYLPDEVVKWAGLDSRDPDVGDAYVSQMNDTGIPFENIADKIEENL